MNREIDEIREQQADERNQMQPQRSFMDDAQRDDAPCHQQQRREPAHRGNRDIKARIEQVQFRPRRLIDGKNGVDKHHQEQLH